LAGKSGKLENRGGAEMGYPKGIIAFVDMSWQYSYLESVFGGWDERFSEHFREHFIELQFAGMGCEFMIDRVVKLKPGRQKATKGEG